MTETANEKPENESIGRCRYSLKPFAHLIKDSDDSDEANDIEESEESDDYSEDEWNSGANKKKKKRSTSINIVPARTLKKKLAEKTKALRKRSGKSNNKPPEPVELSKAQPDLELKINIETPILKQPKVESANDQVKIEIEKTETSVKSENIVVSTNTTTAEIKIKPPEPAILSEKTEKSESVVSVETPKKNQPVVLTYSTMKNSSNISPFLLNNGLSPELSSPAASSSCFGATFSSSVSSPSIISPVPTVTSTTSVPLIANLTPTPPSPRIRIRSNLQASPAFRDSLTVPCRPVVAPIIPGSTRPRVRTPIPRVYRARVPRTPQSYQRSPTSPIVTNSSSRPRKPPSNQIPVAHSRSLSGVQSSPVPSSRTTTSNHRTTPSFKDSNSLRNIASGGTVIYSGSNSVTITPRKVAQDRPPVQRKLFKNEIEGIVAVRHENGVMKYVLNLANGTHMPLTDLQVAKLREQNGGRLPPKLKIPVPSDVAAKIEPSYLIED